MPKADKPSHAERVAAQLIEQLKQGTAPWQRPWEDGPSALPHNGRTGRRYHGINVVHLMAQWRQDPRWMTYKQAEQIGAQVRKGERGVTVQHWQFTELVTELDERGRPKLDGDGKVIKVEAKLDRPRVRYARLFNAEQIEGLQPLEVKPPTWDPLERAEEVLQASGATIEHGGNRAYYSSAHDKIVLPARGQFADAARYYATALHELGHWTGAESRLGRDLGHPFGSEAYAREELRAEIASMLIGAELGVGHDPSQHASYVESWVAALKSDPLEIFRAAADAEQILDYTLALTQTHEQERSPRATTVARSSEGAEAAAETRSTERVDLHVHYDERSQVKELGAKWDRAARTWYVPAGLDPKPFAQWQGPEAAAGLQQRLDRQAARRAPIAPEDRTYLAVPPAERFAAKAAGARWDKAAKAWYVGPDVDRGQLRPHWQVDAVLACSTDTGEPREEFRDALLQAGFQVSGDQPIMDGRKHRLPVEGDRGSKSGVYIGHLTGGVPAGYIHNHRTGEEIRWKQEGVALNAEQRAQVAAHLAQTRTQRAAESARSYESTASLVQVQLEVLKPVIAPTAYMQAKGVQVHAGAFTDEGLSPAAQGTTYLPLYDANGTHWSMQYIRSDGRKRLAAGGRKAGNFHPVGGLSAVHNAPAIVIAEGYATAATAAEILGQAAVAAVDAGNLKPVAEALRKRHPDKPILIVGDDDKGQEAKSGRNPGRDKATEAAQAVGGTAVFPLFAPGEQEADPRRYSDFNDLANHSALGRDSARAQLRSVYDQMLRQARRQAQQGQSAARSSVRRGQA